MEIWKNWAGFIFGLGWRSSCVEDLAGLDIWLGWVGMVWLFQQNCLGTVGVVVGFRVWLGLKIWLIWAIYLLSLCNLLGWSLEICLGGGLFFIGDLVGLGFKVGWVEYFVKFGGFSLVG